MKLREWRESKGWSRAHLAKTLNKKLNRTEPLIGDSHVQAWEGDTMPAADVGEAIRKLSKGLVVW